MRAAQTNGRKSCDSLNSLHAGLCAITMALLSPTIASSQQPGDALHVRFGNPSQKSVVLQIRFRYSPPGYLPEVDPDEPTTYGPTPVKIDGFWIAESELSQRNYKHIQRLNRLIPSKQAIDLPDVAELLARGGQWLTNSLPPEPHAVKKGTLRFAPFEDDNKPVFGLTAAECVRICHVLQETAQTPARPKPAIRFPTFQEWQYACRAISSANDPNCNSQELAKRRHFHSWPEDPLRSFDRLKKDYLALDRRGGSLDEMTQHKLFEAKRFRATQDDLLAILTFRPPNKGVPRFSSHQKRQALFVLHHFLKENTGFRDTFGVDFSSKQLASESLVARLQPSRLAPALPAKSGYKNTNDWHLHHMHGNVPEWCMETSDAIAGWNALVQTYIQGLEPPSDSPAFRLAGGRFYGAFFRTFVIWDGNKVSAADASKGSRMQVLMPGIRIVLAGSSESPSQNE